MTGQPIPALITHEELDELVDVDPLRLRNEAYNLRHRAEQAEAAIARVRELAERFGVTDPGLQDEILAVLDDPPDAEQTLNSASEETGHA